MSEVIDPGTAAVREPGPAAEPPPPPPGPGELGSAGTMTLVDHLSELRRRIAISVLAIVLFAVLGFVLAPGLIELMLTPLPGGEVVFLSVSGGFFVFMRIAVIVGILLALPVILYQTWAFVAPGLTPSERRASLPWIPLSVVFFLLGVLVAWVTLPFAVGFLLSFQVEGALTPMTSAEAYFGFVTNMFLIFGLVMQFPIVLVFLDKLGILDVGQLEALRRYVLFGIVVFAVVITPGGDPVSPIIMSVVMYGLYEFTIFLLKRRATDAPADG